MATKKRAYKPKVKGGYVERDKFIDIGGGKHRKATAKDKKEIKQAKSWGF
jgi:hypothetical protein